MSRLRSSSKLRHSFSHKQTTSLQTCLAPEVVVSQHMRKPFVSSWPGPLLPLALAVSAGSLAFRSCDDNGLSYCQAPNFDQTSKRIGGKDSTNYLVKGSYKKVPQELIDELKAICKENLTMDYDERYFHGKPQNSFHKAVNIPDVIVFPRSEEEVSKIVASCNKYKVPIVPYGGATSLEGHTLSPSGGVCIDMTLMKV
ncbi:UNVERIFIED_CONTAM: D-lactate dehydrogenase [cytochrome], mitochondrial [Sesamum calycinum]|uniref:D-lactate dehydrogenase [cytochrome], mitochondrial n=1 Tax=Sesamum calycinum TaxID=2727403 RepID=A0AAW2KVZ7_9LAMI